MNQIVGFGESFHACKLGCITMQYSFLYTMPFNIYFTVAAHGIVKQ